MANSNSASESAFNTKIEVYFVPWDTLTRSRLSPEDVKRICSVSMVIKETYFISRIERQLAKLVFRKHKGPTEEARLVLELFKNDGSSVLYYASRSDILTENSDRVAVLDPEFIETLNVFGFPKP